MSAVRIEAAIVAVGVSSDGKVRLQTLDNVFTCMAPDTARWLAAELNAAAARAEKIGPPPSPLVAWFDALPQAKKEELRAMVEREKESVK